MYLILILHVLFSSSVGTTPFFQMSCLLYITTCASGDCSFVDIDGIGDNRCLNFLLIVMTHDENNI
jgi:hypothetical protein